MQNSALVSVLQKKASLTGTRSERLARMAVEYPQIDPKGNL